MEIELLEEKSVSFAHGKLLGSLLLLWHNVVVAEVACILGMMLLPAKADLFVAALL